MRPTYLVLTVCLGLAFFAGTAAIAESATPPVQVAQATDAAPTNDKTQLEKEGVSGTAILVVLVVIIVLIAMAMFGGDDFDPAPVGTTFHDVPDDDEPFVMGDFWFEGIYYRSGHEYLIAKGHDYTNRMYNANFETWGLGQGRDTERDEMVLQEAKAPTSAMGDTLFMDEELVVAELDDDITKEAADSAG
jgi:hypothetical protein